MTELREKIKIAFSNECTTTDKVGKTVIKGSPMDIIDWIENFVSTLQLDRGKQLPSEKQITDLVFDYCRKIPMQQGNAVREWIIIEQAYKDGVYKGLSLLTNREIEEINQANISHIEAANELCKQKDTEIIALTKQLEEANKAYFEWKNDLERGADSRFCDKMNSIINPKH